MPQRWHDDATLIRSCRQGHAGAWETLIRRYRRLIYSIPVSYRLSAPEADDIFQQVTVKLFEHLDRIRKTDSLASWLLVTTRRECQAWQRGARRWNPIGDDASEALREDPPELERELHTVACQHTLSLAFGRLDEPCRELLGALYLEEPGPSYEELAQRLGRPVGSLGPTRKRCLKKLQKLYVQLGGAQP